jgi:hypothetical protein
LAEINADILHDLIPNQEVAIKTFSWFREIYGTRRTV